MRHPGNNGRLASLVVLLALVAARPSHGEPLPFDPLSSADTHTVDMVRTGAMRRLRSSACQEVLADFKDAHGRTPLENLQPYALTPDEYLARVLFFDGTERRLCRDGQSQLVTTVGRGVNVFVCRPFLKTAWKDRTMAEVYVIHEMLHTLGVPENPPTSREITHRVVSRCAS